MQHLRRIVFHHLSTVLARPVVNLARQELPQLLHRAPADDLPLLLARSVARAQDRDLRAGQRADGCGLGSPRVPERYLLRRLTPEGRELLLSEAGLFIGRARSTGWPRLGAFDWLLAQAVADPQIVARFRLYRLRFLQENMCFAAFFKIYQILKLKILKFDKILQILRHLQFFC